MKHTKVIAGVALLLTIITAFSDCSLLKRQQYSVVDKRMMSTSNPDALPQAAGDTIYKLINQMVQSKSQFAFLYLHNSPGKLTFDNKNVQGGLQEAVFPTNGSPWPADPINFVMALPIGDKRAKNNFGHSENQILPLLKDMVQRFRELHQKCPKYVILGSALPPCIAAQNRVGSCADKLVTTRLDFKEICSETEFYLILGKPNSDQKSKDSLQNIVKAGITILQPSKYS